MYDRKKNSIIANISKGMLPCTSWLVTLSVFLRLSPNTSSVYAIIVKNKWISINIFFFLWVGSPHTLLCGGRLGQESLSSQLEYYE